MSEAARSRPWRSPAWRRPGGGYGDEGDDYRRDTAAYGQGDDYDRDDVFTPARPVQPTAAETTAVYEPQPIPDDTGSYGVYGDTGYHQGSPHDQYAATAQGADQAYAYDYSGYGQQQGYDATGQQQYAAYSDPYIGNPDLRRHLVRHRLRRPAVLRPAGLRPGPVRHRQLGGETPPGGVWVPQQRTDEYGRRTAAGAAVPVPGRRAADAADAGNGFDEQYRF